jgi:NAD(P)H dehydrogenase (quinone)
MQKPTILVTAAAGKTGAATALQLLAQGYPVRALVRREDGRSQRLKLAGAEIMVGSLEDLADLRAGLKGVQRAYFCPPLESGMLRKTAIFAAAAEEARLEVVVALSQWVTDPLHPAIHAREKWLAGKLLERLRGVDIVTVNPGFFADNYMAALEPIAQLGVFGMPLGDGLNAPPSNEDIARVIVGALTDPAPHIGKRYRPTGPRLLAPDDIAAAFSKVLGHRVKYQNAPIGLFLKVAKTLKISDYVILQLHAFLRDYQRNSFGVGAPTSAVLEVGGAQPEDFEQIVRRYVAASPLARRTVRSRLEAVYNVAAALLSPAPDLDAMARRIEAPTLSHARLAADSDAWLFLHDPSHGGSPRTQGKIIAGA